LRDLLTNEFEIIEDKPRYQLTAKAQEHLNFWKTIKPYGKVIAGTNILPMKTPLMRPKWNENLQPDEQFNLVELIKDYRHEGKKIGTVIDLNLSDRGYYSWDITYRKNKDLLRNVEYRKIKINYGEIPDKSVLNKVYDVLNKNFFKDHLIAVHCTHGINRSGYAICDFLCKRFKMNPEEAVKKFSEARGYNFEKKVLVDDLIDKFGESFAGRDPYKNLS